MDSSQCNGKEIHSQTCLEKERKFEEEKNVKLENEVFRTSYLRHIHLVVHSAQQRFEEMHRLCVRGL